MIELSENKATVGKLIEKIAAEYGSEVLKALLRPGVSVLLNGQYIELLGGESTRVSEGDRIAIIPPIAGGET